MKKARVSGTKEWSNDSVNIQTGCLHDCRYGYCKAMAIRFGRATPESWTKATPLKNAAKQLSKKYNGVTMFPTTHDIYPENLEAVTNAIVMLLDRCEKLLIVTKPHLVCVRALCETINTLEMKHKVLFRFTIGSADDNILSYWEPGAPKFEERLASLRMAYGMGFATSVSCEPMLDDNIAAVVDAARPYVTDAIWLGIPNKLKSRVALNCPGDAVAKDRAERLDKYWDKEHVTTLYARWNGYPFIRWKDSVKAIIGIPSNEKAGMDV